jgi:hypothetical protein
MISGRLLAYGMSTSAGRLAVFSAVAETAGAFGGGRVMLPN